MNHLEVNSVVIGVAFNAGGSPGCGTREGCMEPFVLLNLCGNFPMALTQRNEGDLVETSWHLMQFASRFKLSCARARGPGEICP